MEILVINGSPKGKNSITLQTVLFLQQRFPEHHFEILHAGQRIKALEKDFSPALTALEQAELILFSYPVYTFLAPCQLHRFIELVKASGISLEGKFASQISTSKHFYDITAHRYIQDNVQELGMNYIRGLSADMDDLLKEQGQKEAVDFLKYVTWCVEHDIYEALPASGNAPVHKKVAVPDAAYDSKPGDVVIVTDCAPGDTQL